VLLLVSFCGNIIDKYMLLLVTLKLCGEKNGGFKEFFEQAELYDVMLPHTQTQVMLI
jgi:hypothetical protein